MQLAKPNAPVGSVGLDDRGIDNEAVRRQLEILIASPLFSQSRRYSSLLRYVVEETLEGRASRLKERTVGIDVFNRAPSYDTTADPVVRTTAAQLRHRIAQYYAQPGHEDEIRISLPAGAYVPEFRPAANNKLFAMRVEVAPEATAESVPSLVGAPLSRNRRFPLISERMVLYTAVGALALVLITIGFSQIRASRRDPSLRKFWGAVWDSGGGSVLICIGGGPGNFGGGGAEGFRQVAGGPTASQVPGTAATDPTVGASLRSNSVAWPDAMVTAELAGLAKSSGQAVRLGKSGLIAFADLRESPDILVGGFNNQWIMRLDANLRYRYVRDRDADLSYIQDEKNPDQRAWGVHYREPYSAFLHDYGMITRVLDPSTEKMVVIASGIASYGTMAAGDFLAQEKYMKMVADRAPAGWEHKNMQVVFSTEVISGNAGPPRILAVWFW